MELVTNGSGSGDGGISLGSRAFSPLDHSLPEVATFVRGMLASISLDGVVGEALATASLIAFSLFTRLGVHPEDIQVSARAAEEHFILDITNGLDFQAVLRDEGGLLSTTNLDLTSLIAFIDEVHIGRTEEGRSLVRLAVRLPASA